MCVGAGGAERGLGRLRQRNQLLQDRIISSLVTVSTGALENQRRLTNSSVMGGRGSRRVPGGHLKSPKDKGFLCASSHSWQSTQSWSNEVSHTSYQTRPFTSQVFIEFFARRKALLFPVQLRDWRAAVERERSGGGNY